MIWDEYVQSRARKTGVATQEIADQVDRNTWYEQVYALHARLMRGEFSLGYMSKALGITKPDLYHLLDSMGLKVTNV
jgi:hypothetical protein